jgi:hypothetical protein
LSGELSSEASSAADPARVRKLADVVSELAKKG